MQRLIFVAAILLVIQIGLAITLISNNRTLEAFTPQAKLVEFAPETINTLTIEGDGKTLEIKKQGSVWILPDTFLIRVKTPLSLLISSLRIVGSKGWSGFEWWTTFPF